MDIKAESDPSHVPHVSLYVLQWRQRSLHRGRWLLGQGIREWAGLLPVNLDMLYIVWSVLSQPQLLQTDEYSIIVLLFFPSSFTPKISGKLLLFSLKHLYAFFLQNNYIVCDMYNLLALHCYSIYKNTKCWCTVILLQPWEMHLHNPDYLITIFLSLFFVLLCFFLMGKQICQEPLCLAYIHNSHSQLFAFFGFVPSVPHYRWKRANVRLWASFHFSFPPLQRAPVLCVHRVQEFDRVLEMDRLFNIVWFLCFPSNLHEIVHCTVKSWYVGNEGNVTVTWSAT